MELDADAKQVLFSTFLGGQAPAPVSFLSTYSTATAIAIDALGNVFVAGQTVEADFPRKGNFDGCSPFVNIFGDGAACPFVVKINPAGKLVYSILTVSGGGCTRSGQRLHWHSTSYGTGDGLAVDAGGVVTMSAGLGGVFNTATFRSSPGGG